MIQHDKKGPSAGIERSKKSTREPGLSQEQIAALRALEEEKISTWMVEHRNPFTLADIERLRQESTNRQKKD